jgi:hypothetical protein
VRADVLVNQLFDEWAASYARGENPDPRGYLERAGMHADDLSTLMEGYLRAAPRLSASVLATMPRGTPAAVSVGSRRSMRALASLARM